MKNAFSEFIRMLEIAEKRINLRRQKLPTVKCKEKRKWKTKTKPKSEQNIQKLWDTMERYSINVTGKRGLLRATRGLNGKPGIGLEP